MSTQRRAILGTIGGFAAGFVVAALLHNYPKDQVTRHRYCQVCAEYEETYREGVILGGRPDPYAPLWLELTAKRRASFEMDPIAWGLLPGMDPEEDPEEENPTCQAADRAAVGDRESARELLMDVLCRDLRCIDAHAHLGNLEFERDPEQAILHYEVGVRIGELSLPPGFDGVLAWGRLYNRPFLRCLHGYGLCLWRRGQLAAAQQVFERMLSLSPNDNQGVRICWNDVRRGRSWEVAQAAEGA